MDPLSSAPMAGCPASPVIAAVRLAKTPLAIADARAAGAPILFANEAFGALLGCETASLVGRPLAQLSTAPDMRIAPNGTWLLDIETEGGNVFAAALSTAAVAGVDGSPMCLLCSLVDARGEGADVAIRRDAGLLREVAHAAGDLMRESGIAAAGMPPHDHDTAATRIAQAAVERARPRPAA